MKIPHSPKPILYAEDDENDVFLLQRAFRQAGLADRLQVVSDGQLAIDYLSGAAPYDDRTKYPLPCLALLDLKMPRLSGLEVLRWIRGYPPAAALPALILTSSNQPSDIARAYQLGANGYLVKPGRPDELTAMVKGINDYWLTQNCMPEN